MFQHHGAEESMLSNGLDNAPTLSSEDRAVSSQAQSALSAASEQPPNVVGTISPNVFSISTAISTPPPTTMVLPPRAINPDNCRRDIIIISNHAAFSETFGPSLTFEHETHVHFSTHITIMTNKSRHTTLTHNPTDTADTSFAQSTSISTIIAVTTSTKTSPESISI